MFIGVACTIPDLPNLPGQGGESVSVTLDYPSNDVCYDGATSPSDASPAGGTFSYTGSGTLDLNTSTGAINAAGSDPGSYTVIYTKSGVSSNFPIVIGNDITLSITPVPGATICTGDTATLTANASGGSGSFSYLWSTGDTTQAISVTTTGTYTVTVTDSNNCTAQASQLVTASTAGTTIASINNDDAMSFNGTDQYVSFPNLTLSSNEYSISLWMYSDQGANVGYFLTDGNTAGGSTVGFKIDNNGTNIGRLEYWDGSSNRIFGTISSPASWNHIAFVANVSSNTITSYINGSVDVTATGVTVQTMYNLIGAYTPTGSNRFVGKLDEVAIFDSKLSSCDIKGIYEATTTVSGQPKSANLLDANTTIPAPVYWNRMGDS
jgi:hypothetical protein